MLRVGSADLSLLDSIPLALFIAVTALIRFLEATTDTYLPPRKGLQIQSDAT